MIQPTRQPELPLRATFLARGFEEVIRQSSLAKDCGAGLPFCRVSNNEEGELCLQVRVNIATRAPLLDRRQCRCSAPPDRPQTSDCPTASLLKRPQKLLSFPKMLQPQNATTSAQVPKVSCIVGSASVSDCWICQRGGDVRLWHIADEAHCGSNVR